MDADHIASCLTKRVSGVRFVNMTKLLEKDTDEAIKESQNRPVFITDFHERSHWNDLLQSMNIKLCKMWSTK
jgi:hypothetical protein